MKHPRLAVECLVFTCLLLVNTLVFLLPFHTIGPFRETIAWVLAFLQAFGVAVFLHTSSLKVFYRWILAPLLLSLILFFTTASASIPRSSTLAFQVILLLPTVCFFGWLSILLGDLGWKKFCDRIANSIRPQFSLTAMACFVTAAGALVSHLRYQAFSYESLASLTTFHFVAIIFVFGSIAFLMGYQWGKRSRRSAKPSQVEA